jgi:DNA recombination protein RmuC
MGSARTWCPWGRRTSRAATGDALHREWHIKVAGPTTLLSLLVSLQVGFRSLAIQKHSNEVLKVLAAVKTEFGKFGGILDKVSKKLQETQNVIDV